MPIHEANHICKNKNCPNGINGKPKHYYACDFCDRTKQWRSMACCPECYDAYIQQVIEARAKNKKVDILPDRTDKNETEVKELFEKPVEEVLESTKVELNEYLEDGRSIAQAIDKINEDIDNISAKKKKNRNRI